MCCILLTAAMRQKYHLLKWCSLSFPRYLLPDFRPVWKRDRVRLRKKKKERKKNTQHDQTVRFCMISLKCPFQVRTSSCNHFEFETTDSKYNTVKNTQKNISLPSFRHHKWCNIYIYTYNNIFPYCHNTISRLSSRGRIWFIWVFIVFTCHTHN